MDKFEYFYNEQGDFTIQRIDKDEPIIIGFCTLEGNAEQVVNILNKRVR